MSWLIENGFSLSKFAFHFICFLLTYILLAINIDCMLENKFSGTISFSLYFWRLLSNDLENIFLTAGALGSYRRDVDLISERKRFKNRHSYFHNCCLDFSFVDRRQQIEFWEFYKKALSSHPWLLVSTWLHGFKFLLSFRQDKRKSTFDLASLGSISGTSSTTLANRVFITSQSSFSLRATNISRSGGGQLCVSCPRKSKIT